MAYVQIDGKMEKIDSFCGEAPPRPIMSNGPRLFLEFRGLTSSRHARGFKAVYSFTESKIVSRYIVNVCFRSKYFDKSAECLVNTVLPTFGVKLASRT